MMGGDLFGLENKPGGDLSCVAKWLEGICLGEKKDGRGNVRRGVKNGKGIVRE